MSTQEKPRLPTCFTWSDEYGRQLWDEAGMQEYAKAAEAASIERCAASVKALHALISDPSIVGDERSDGAHNALCAAEIAIRALLPKEE